jgi:hypothetical protein
MIPRRKVVTGGVLGGLGAFITGEAEATADPAVARAVDPALADVSDEMVGRIVQAITGLRTEVQNLKSFGDLAPVRDAQLTFLRANGKFPDLMEVGISVWFAVHDWHVRWQQPLNISRDAQARYTILLNQTSLVMRTDVTGTFIGLPYDNR